MKLLKFISLMLTVGVILLWSNQTVQAEEDFLSPFEVDDNTVLLMHFDDPDNLMQNESDRSEDGMPEGKIRQGGSVNSALGPSLWIDNDSPDVDTSMVVIPHTDDLNLPNSFTIEGWSNNITFDGGNSPPRSYNPWVIRKGHGDGNMTPYGIMVNPFTQSFEATNIFADHTSDPYTRIKTEFGTVDLGEWYHFTLIKDMEHQARVLLIHDSDGNLLHKTTRLFPEGSSGETAIEEEPLYFGVQNQSHKDVGNFYWNGFLDEVRISDVVRDYDAPPAIGNIQLDISGQNPRANTDVPVIAEVRNIGSNILSGNPTLHYETGDGNWQTVTMTQGDSSFLYVGTIPGQPRGTMASYYITAESDAGVEGRYPDVFAPNSAVGWWQPNEMTLSLTFDEGPGSTPTDASDYGHTINMLGENLGYSDDVPPALAGESAYSISINQDLDGEYPDTSSMEIPAPTPFINGAYDDDGIYGWTLDFWLKADTADADWEEGNMMVIRVGPRGSQQAGEMMHRFDLFEDRFRMRFKYHYAELEVDVPGIGSSGKWFRIECGETTQMHFVRVHDENDSLIARNQVDKSTTEGRWKGRGPYPDTYSILPFKIGNSWDSDDYRGLIDEVKFYNYPKDVRPNFLGGASIGNQAAEAPAAVTANIAHPGSKIEAAEVHYTSTDDNGEWHTAELSPDTGNAFVGEIPGQPLGSITKYYLSAETAGGIKITEPAEAESDSVYYEFGWWEPNTQTLDLTFEEGSGGSVTDHSEYDHPFVNVSAEYSDDAIEGDYSIYFDGSGSYLKLEEENATFIPSKEYTLDFWFKPDSALDNGTRLIAKYAANGWHKGTFHVRTVNDGAEIGVWPTLERTFKYKMKFDSSYAVNAWNHLIMEVATGTLSVQLRDENDELVQAIGEKLPEDDHPELSKGPLFIGTGEPGDNDYTGKMDNIQLYNYSVNLGEETATEPEPSGIPERFTLSQNYPNPFNPSTTIRYTVPAEEHVTITIYDLLGREVKTLVNKNLIPGQYSSVWNGKNDAGDLVSSGVYFYRLRAGEVTKVRKMVLLR